MKSDGEREERSIPILLDRLAVCREAFEKIAELNQDCAPELKHIMASKK